MFKKLMVYLFPFHFGPFRKCVNCGRIKEKSDMILFSNDYFCSEAESLDYFESYQW
jgi:hypothetical protein